MSELKGNPFPQEQFKMLKLFFDNLNSLPSNIFQEYYVHQLFELNFLFELQIAIFGKKSKN